ncbi:phage holin family protein [Patescibacteria group bacterium]|nr:phage holin family protein [Patescibacteria group bacterium]
MLKFLATPINILTLGIASIITNMIILYAFQYVVSRLDIGITVSLGSIEQTFILSIIIALLTLILKKIF